MLAPRDYAIPGLDALRDEVRARHLALGAPGSPANFGDLLERVTAALPPEICPKNRLRVLCGVADHDHGFADHAACERYNGPVAGT